MHTLLPTVFSFHPLVGEFSNTLVIYSTLFQSPLFLTYSDPARCTSAQSSLLNNASVLSTRLPLLLPHTPEAPLQPHSRLHLHLLNLNLPTMTATPTFTMPGPLDESVAKSQPPVAEAERATPNGFAPAQKEPLAHDGVKHPSGVTFAAQDKLPKLPIPELDSTLKKYVQALKPLQSTQEQRNTAAAVEEFLRSEGPELQARLKKYATGRTSYLEQFCEIWHVHGWKNFVLKTLSRV